MNNFSRAMVLQGAENIEIKCITSSRMQIAQPAHKNKRIHLALKTFRDDLCFRLGEHKGDNSTFCSFPHHFLALRGPTYIIISFFNK